MSNPQPAAITKPKFEPFATKEERKWDWLEKKNKEHERAQKLAGTGWIGGM